MKNSDCFPPALEIADELERLRANCAELTVAGVQAYKALVSTQALILKMGGAMDPNHGKAIENLKAALERVFDDFADRKRESGGVR